MKYLLVLATALSGTLLPAAARAQLSSTLIQNTPPIEYDRGRNVSVQDRARPDYDPLGVRAGSFLIFPRVDVGIGYSDNVFLTDGDEVSDGYVAVAPSMQMQSDWSRHQFTASGAARIRRYFSNSPRNQDEWNGNVLGRADIGDAFSVTGEGQVARVQEDPFSGQSASATATLSSYNRTLAGVRGQYRAGAIRAQLGYTHQTFDFNRIEVTDGTSFSQADRDRDIDQVAGQLEYALSPSTAIYGQLLYDNTSYRRSLLNGNPNRDSDGYRAIVGLSMDVSGFFRGTLGVGYSRRNYDSPFYRNVSGLSAEGQLEYFRSELTTFTLVLRRVIEDANLGNTSAFWDNRASLRVDHELLRNLILNASAEYGTQKYVDSSLDAKIWRLRGGGRYLLTRELSLAADAGYGHRRFSGSSFNSTINEFQGVVSLILQR